MRHLALAISLFLIGSTLYGQQTRTLLKTNTEGEITEGSVDILIEEINKGKKVRVGWQLDFNDDKEADLQHWIDANYITIIGGHVFNQVDPIYTQLPYTDIPQVSMMRSDWKWTAIIGTNGILQSRFIIPGIMDLEDEKEQQRLLKKSEIREKKVATSWVIMD